MSSLVLVTVLFSDVGFAAPSNKILDQRLLVVESRLEQLQQSTGTEVVLELLKKLEQLQAELARLQSRVESQENQLEQLKKRQRDLYLDVDRRLNDLQLVDKQRPAQLGAKALSDVPANELSHQSADTNAVTVTDELAVDPAQERSDYEEAFNYLREGRYQEAISAFQELLTKYPKGRFADNAQYWIGEANYVTRNFEQALLEFEKSVTLYPNGSKRADAQLKLGYTYYELQQWEQARKALTEVLTKYPTSKAATLAEKRLLSMTRDGH